MKVDLEGEEDYRQAIREGRAVVGEWNPKVSLDDDPRLTRRDSLDLLCRVFRVLDVYRFHCFLISGRTKNSLDFRSPRIA